MFKKGNFDSSFNGPIESVDDVNEKDFLFFFLFLFFCTRICLIEEDVIADKKGKKKKRRRRDIFLLGRHHQFTLRKSCVWKTTVGPVFGSHPRLSLLSLFYFIISLVDVVGVHTIKVSALLHFPSSSPCCNWREPISFLLSSCRRCLLGIESSLFPLE